MNSAVTWLLIFVLSCDEHHRKCFTSHASMIVVELSLRDYLRIVQVVDCNDATSSKKFISKLCQTSSNLLRSSS